MATSYTTDYLRKIAYSMYVLMIKIGLTNEIPPKSCDSRPILLRKITRYTARIGEQP